MKASIAKPETPSFVVFEVTACTDPPTARAVGRRNTVEEAQELAQRRQLPTAIKQRRQEGKENPSATYSDTEPKPCPS